MPVGLPAGNDPEIGVSHASIDRAQPAMGEETNREQLYDHAVRPRERRRWPIWRLGHHGYSEWRRVRLHERLHLALESLAAGGLSRQEGGRVATAL